MKRSRSWLYSGSFALCLVLACTGKDGGKVDALQKQNAALEAEIQKLQAEGASAGDKAPHALPASLAELYPPKAEQPVLPMRMIGMAMPLEAAIADLFEQDGENAAKGFEAFKAQYTEVRQLVPEWTEDFPLEPVDELGKAIASGDPNQVMPAVGKLSAVCAGCHTKRMAAVQFTYGWGDFSAIEVEDPVTKQKVGFKQLMLFAASSFSAIGADLQQGQKDAAVKQLEAFKARFEAIGDACSECHESDRAYFVDDTINGMIAELGKEVAKDAPDGKRIQELSMGIGMESCYKCHLVHMPAALWQSRGEVGGHGGPPAK